MAPAGAPDYASSLGALTDAFGHQSPLGTLTTLPQSSLFEREQAREERNNAATASEKLGSMVRQDSPIDGWVAGFVGSQFKPDPNFDPFEPKGLAEASKGLPEEYQHELLKATSAEHRLYLRSRLDDKMVDMQRLGDMGVPGNIARFLVGLVEPTNLALGLVSGGAVSALRGAKLGTQVAAGLGTGFAAGAGFEKARQSANFEDSNPDAAWAGLMGLAFSVPFVGLSAREAYRLRSVASQELHGNDNVALRKAHEEEFQPTTDVVARENGPVRKEVTVESPNIPNPDPLSVEPRAKPASITFYRGQKGEFPPTTDERGAGRYFTTDRKGAEVYGDLHSVDVPADEAAALLKEDADYAASERIYRPAGTAVLPAKYANAAKPVANLATGAGNRAHDAHKRYLKEAYGPGMEDEVRDTVLRATAARDAAYPNDVVLDGGLKGANAERAVYEAALESASKRREESLRRHLGDAMQAADESEARFTDAQAREAGTASANEPVAGGFLPGGSVGGAQIEHAPVEITPLRKLRFDIAARFNKSENPVIQRIGRVLVKDALPTSDHYAQGLSVSEDKKMLQRTVAGNFHFESVSAFKDAAGKLGYGPLERYFPSRARQFNEDAGRFMRDPAAFDAAPHKAELQRVATAAQKAYSTMLEEMQKAGVTGADQLAANPGYLNRQWLPAKIHELQALHGEKEVTRLVAKSIRDKEGIIKRFREKNPESAFTDDAILEQSASKFIASIKRLEHSHLSNELLLTATDAPTLRAELEKKLSPSEAASVIDNLFEHQEATSGDAGKPANLKYRFNLDEGARHVTDKGETIHLHQLMENDVRVLLDRYMSSMAGHVAMARQGIKSRADFMALLREAEVDHEAHSASRIGEAFGADKQLAMDMYDHIVGRPMSFQNYNKGDQVAGIFRAYARSVYLGQLGFTAMGEAFHSAGISTWRAAFQQMPTLRDAVKASLAGHRPSEGLVHDVSQMLGYFNEMVSGHVRQHEVTEFTYDGGLKKWENAANTLSHATDMISGNAFMTTLTRGMAAAGAIQKYVNFARGEMKLDAAWRRRIVGSGINADDIDHVLSQLKDHVELDGKRVVGVKWEEWSAKDPNSYHDFLTAVDRDVRQGVQDHDIGETWLGQHTSLGKFFTELRAFNIAGHSKQFLNGIHYRDRTTYQLFATSIAVNGLAYVVQTAANFGHNPKELEKRLTPQRIAQAAYTRSNMMGLLPFFTDTLVPGFVSPFAKTTGQGLTANTDSRNILLPPSFNLLAKGVNFMQNGKPQDGLSLIPFSNTYGARNLLDLVGQAHPNTKAP